MPILLIIRNSIRSHLTSTISPTTAVNSPLKSTMKTQERRWWLDWWSASDSLRTRTSGESRVRPWTSRPSRKSCQCPPPASSLNSSLSGTRIQTHSAKQPCTHVITRDAASSSKNHRGYLIISGYTRGRSRSHALLKDANKASIKSLIKRSILIRTKVGPTWDAESAELKSPKSNLLSTTKIV